MPPYDWHLQRADSLCMIMESSWGMFSSVTMGSVVFTHIDRAQQLLLLSHLGMSYRRPFHTLLAAKWELHHHAITPNNVWGKVIPWVWLTVQLLHIPALLAPSIHQLLFKVGGSNVGDGMLYLLPCLCWYSTRTERGFASYILLFQASVSLDF